MRNKQGGLAFINKSMRPQNIGLVVECQEYLGYYLQGDIIEVNKEHFEAIISDNYWIIYHSHGMIETEFGSSKIAYAPDTWLTPITPPEMDEEIEDELNYELETVK